MFVKFNLRPAKYKDNSRPDGTTLIGHHLSAGLFCSILNQFGDQAHAPTSGWLLR